MINKQSSKQNSLFESELLKKMFEILWAEI